MFVARIAFAVLVALALVGACNAPGAPAPETSPGTNQGGAGPEVTAPQVAERLMAALVAEDYAAAHGDLSTGLARDFADAPADLQATIERQGGPITDYELTAPRRGGEGVDDGKTIIEGTVTLADGSTRSLTIVMSAIGLLADPWRIDRFELGEPSS